MRVEGFRTRAGTGRHAARNQNSLQPPVPLEVLLNWCPIRLHINSELSQQWLLVYLGDLDVRTLNNSGCTSQELLDLCSERLDAIDVEGGAGFVAVVDLRGATPAQLGSSWWQVFLPALIDLIVTSFRGALRAVYVVRAGRTAQMAASRLLDPLRQVGIHVHVGRDEVKDQDVLQEADLGDVFKQMRRDEICPDHSTLRPRAPGRSATLLAAVFAALSAAALTGSSAASAIFLAGIAAGLAGSVVVVRRTAGQAVSRGLVGGIPSADAGPGRRRTVAVV